MYWKKYMKYCGVITFFDKVRFERQISETFLNSLFLTGHVCTQLFSLVEGKETKEA